jgi:hypothetical protein
MSKPLALRRWSRSRPSGVVDRHDDHDRVVEDLLGRAVGASSQVVQHLERGVAAALLAAVRAAVHPQDRGRVLGQLLRLRLECLRIAEGLDRVLDAGESRLDDVVRLTDDGVVQILAEHRRGGGPRDHAVARRVDGGDVVVGLIARDLLGADRERRHEHVLARRDRRVVDGLCLDRVAGGLCRGGRDRGERR